jgi:hypothetical protein
MFIASFIIDKQVTTLIGRPPRLSRRFASCKLPLDLDDDEVMLIGEELQQRISKLDPNGWNTDGKVSRVACMRAMMIASQIRDEAIELFLGPDEDITEARREYVTSLTNINVQTNNF